MVKVIRLQNPLPKAVLTAIGEAPLINAAAATTTTAIATKMKASGNQRSAHAVKAIAIRTIAPSCGDAPPDDAAVFVIAIACPPKTRHEDSSLERLAVRPLAMSSGGGLAPAAARPAQGGQVIALR